MDNVELEQNSINTEETEILNDALVFIFGDQEGPLDVLLRLIKENKMEIENVQLSLITEQYLDYIKDLQNVDMESAAEFIEIASTLIEIKSKKIIPQESENVVVDLEDPETKLLRRLKEYKLFKEASEKLKEIENVDKFYKLPDDSAGDFKVVLKQMNLDSLINAFSKLLSRVNTEVKQVESKTIERDRWTVEEKMFEITSILTSQEEIRFLELVDSDFTRGEIITLFQALLELLKRQQISVVQEVQYGDIIIKNHVEKESELDE